MENATNNLADISAGAGAGDNDTKRIYYVNQSAYSRNCYYILITNEANEIIRIITPYAGKYGYKDNTLSISSIISDTCKNTIRIGDIYDVSKCKSKSLYIPCQCPNNNNKFYDAGEVLDLISSLWRGGNPGAWAGHSLRMDRDEDGELYGVYKDKETGIEYGGWVSTHRHRYDPVPRVMQ